MRHHAVVAYHMTHTTEIGFDEKIEELAHKYKGRAEGSGYLIPEKLRDLEFSFKKRKRAFRFTKACRNLHRVKTARVLPKDTHHLLD